MEKAEYIRNKNAPTLESLFTTNSIPKNHLVSPYMCLTETGYSRDTNVHDYYYFVSDKGYQSKNRHDVLPAVKPPPSVETRGAMAFMMDGELSGTPTTCPIRGDIAVDDRPIKPEIYLGYRTKEDTFILNSKDTCVKDTCVLNSKDTEIKDEINDLYDSNFIDTKDSTVYISGCNSLENFTLTPKPNTTVLIFNADFQELKSIHINKGNVEEIIFEGVLPKLETLFVADNKLESLDGLNLLTALKTLNVPNNKLKELKGVSNLHNLEYLNCENNDINVIEDIHNTKLKTLIM